MSIPTHRDPRDERLGELLRRGDPYRGEELGTDDLAEIRARVARPAHPQRAYRPLAAAAALLLAVSWIGWRTGVWAPDAPGPATVAPTPPAAAPAERIPPPSPTDPAAPTSTAPPVASTPTRPAETVAAATAIPDAAPAAAANREGAPAPPATAAVAGVEPAPTRAIRFTAPGGTRIVWTLDPTFSLGNDPQ